MSARLHSQLAETFTNPYCVNKFDCQHVADDCDRDAARQRRDDDQHLAALLAEGGLTEAELYAAPPGSEDQLVSRDGEREESLGRALRRWSGFPSQAHRAKVARGLSYPLFAGVHGISAVRQVRVAAPVCSVPLAALRAAHADTSRRLTERLRYGLARHAPGVSIDLIAAHIHRDGEGYAYLHFHLVARGGTPEEWDALERYWVGESRPTGWDWWFAEDDDRLGRHPAALVQYAAAGLAEEIDAEWTPAELAELWRQTRGVALVRAVGEYRRWLGALDADGMTVRRHPQYGVAEIVPRRPAVRLQRHKDKLFTSAGFGILRVVWHDYGDGVLRESWHVRGRPGVTAADVRAVYAVADVTSTGTTAIPESLSAAPGEPPQSPPPTPPPPPRGGASPPPVTVVYDPKDPDDIPF